MLSHKHQTTPPARLTDEVVQPLGVGSLEVNYPEAVAEELRAHDDVISDSELEIAPVFTPEELDFSEYRWGRGDYRSQRDMDLYESGHSARDFF